MKDVETSKNLLLSTTNPSLGGVRNRVYLTGAHGLRNGLLSRLLSMVYDDRESLPRTIDRGIGREEQVTVSEY